MATAWTRLNDRLQLCYSATDNVHLIYSQYNEGTSLWELHVLDNTDGGSYHWAQLATDGDIKGQRTPPAESESSFIDWVAESLLAGHIMITSGTDKLRFGTAQVYLDVKLEPVEDEEAYQRVSWQLLIKLAHHIQREGCSIGTDNARLLREENEHMNAQLNALMAQQAFFANNPKQTAAEGPSLASHSSSRRPIILPKRKGMSLINPRVKKHLHRTDSDP